jgi:DNA repair exonuclease SbcCD ATPase subunit
MDWLKEKGKYWQKEIRVRQEDVVRAKIELEQRKFENRDGRGRGTTEPEKNLRRAQERLKEAEQKLANCKRWLPQFEHALREYQGPSRQLSGALETDLKQAVALLEQKLLALEAYLKLNPPPSPGPLATGASPETGVATPVAVTSEASEKPSAEGVEAAAPTPQAEPGEPVQATEGDRP